MPDTEQNIPADWVLLEAAGRCGWSNHPGSLETQRYEYFNDAAYRALCDMIAKHEKPPVDEATELWARLLEVSSRRISATDVRNGDGNETDVSAIDFLRTHLTKVRAEKVS